MSLCRKALMCVCLLSLVPTITLAYQNSTILCIANTTGLNTSDTLQENITVYKDGNMTNLTLNTYCPYNCNTIDNVCNPPPYQQNLILFAAVCVAMFLGYKLIRWLS